MSRDDSSDNGPAGTEVILGDSDDGWRAEPSIVIPTSSSADYEVIGDLARGSMGTIKIARDQSLQRLVALKLLDPESALPNAAARFLDEARITAQLQHPSIVPVYSIGTIDADPYFTMQLIEGRTLRDVLDGVRRKDPGDLVRYGRVRLLNILVQVCNSIAYAHSRGVIHRDLKPANVMLGEYGEVFVMDWGLAKIVKSQVERPVVGGRPDEAAFQTRVGDVTGTPAYMAPEQAMGLVDAVSERSDIFALGAMLYEILTLRPPYVADTVRETLRLAQRGQIEPPSVLAPQADIPPTLEAVALRCLAHNPLDRFATVTELRDELEGCLTTSHTVMHRMRGTARTLREAARAGQRFRELARERRRMAREVDATAAVRLPSDPPEQVAVLRAAMGQLRQLEDELDGLFDRAVARFNAVLVEQPDHVGAHDGLRDLFWYRFLEAERFADSRAMAVYRSLAAQHDPNAILRTALEGRGELQLTTRPPGARVEVIRVEQGPLHLIEHDPEPLGDGIAMGSYRLEISAQGHEPVVATAWIGRQETVSLQIELPQAGAVPAGMVFVPAGPFWRGTGDAFVVGPPRLRAHQDAFCIATMPVTVADWAEFAAGPQPAQRLPAGVHWPAGSDGRLHPSEPGQNPITGVSMRLIRAYLQWRREQDGLPWRLPTAGEWEKAARGADGRRFPWGDVWEPTWCRCAEGPEGGAASAVGAELDRSPYGIFDMAGGVREWTRTEHPRDPRRRVVKGGSFATGRHACHLGAAAFQRVDQGAVDLGFRLALDGAVVIAG